MLTDQDNLLSQLNYNMKHDFTKDEFENKLMQAKASSWSTDHINFLFSDLKYDKKGFDAVVNFDCVYEPLCGKIMIFS